MPRRSTIVWALICLGVGFALASLLPSRARWQVDVPYPGAGVQFGCMGALDDSVPHGAQWSILHDNTTLAYPIRDKNNWHMQYRRLDTGEVMSSVLLPRAWLGDGALSFDPEEVPVAIYFQRRVAIFAEMTSFAPKSAGKFIYWKDLQTNKEKWLALPEKSRLLPSERPSPWAIFSHDDDLSVLHVPSGTLYRLNGYDFGEVTLDDRHLVVNVERNGAVELEVYCLDPSYAPKSIAKLPCAVESWYVGPDHRIAVLRAATSELIMWNFLEETEHKLLDDVDDKASVLCKFSGAGKYLAFFLLSKQEVLVFDTASGRVQHSTCVDSDSSHSLSLTFSSDERLLAISDTKKHQAQLEDIVRGRQVWQQEAFYVQFGKDGRRVYRCVGPLVFRDGDHDEPLDLRGGVPLETSQGFGWAYARDVATDMWFTKWLPFEFAPRFSYWLFDVERDSIVLRLSSWVEDQRMSIDDRFIVTLTTHENWLDEADLEASYKLSCWDLSPTRHWQSIIGIPLALFLAGLLFRLAWRNCRLRRVTQCG